mmetsp:Transcript_3238/g.6094  ORF Transcript_3238/g.6094 Transcript_3238/m.6094 type:complete len:137 (-) Transcript_3238:732-1142(-)
MCSNLFVRTAPLKPISSFSALARAFLPVIALSHPKKPTEGRPRDNADKSSSSLVVLCRASFRNGGVQSRTHRNLAYIFSPKIEVATKVLLRVIAEEARVVMLHNVQPHFFRNRICEDVGASLIVSTLNSGFSILPV